ncbi:MAG TPA: hypothetical protein PLF01_06090, partial [Alphaproteobacteria bacterium]|nr:hypothetical protein [Alphaproteobacteria bacterium]
MSLEQAFADPAGSPYSDFSGEISPQAYTTTHQPLPNPQTLISQYSHMLERTGSPISWVPVCEVTADDKEGEKAKKKKFLPLAVYSSFVFPPLRAGEVGFKHAICVFDDEKRSAIAKKISEGHEAMHSSQWARSAALHAVHLNGHSPF